MSKEIELPEGWAWTTFSELITLSQNGYGKRSSNEGIFTIVLKLSDIHKDAISLANTRKIRLTNDEIENYQLLKNDLVCIRVNGSRSLVGRMIRFRIPSRDPIAFCDHFIRFRPANAELAAFLSLYFETKTARRYIELNMVSSAGQNTVSQGTIISVDIPIPPLPEQHRIVAALEQQFSRLDAAVTSLQHARAKLKRQRAAILKAAVEGTLTAEWRAQHPASETAEQLLQRILNERRAKWEAEQLAKMQARGVTPKDDSWKDAYKGPEALDTTELSELPEGWIWASVGQISQIQGGIQKQPSRTPRDNAYPYLRVANVFRGRLDLSVIEKMELFGNELDTLRLEIGDLLIVEGNGSRTEIGRSALWHGEIQDCVHQNHIIRVRLHYISPGYIDYYWNSPDGNDRVMEVAASTSGLYTLSVGKIAKLPIPLPPLAEQQQIVSEVEARLSIIAQTELEVEANLKRAERLRQTILAEAFAGRLVPQDPDDEPASVLLERIRRERDEVQKNGKAGNGRTRTAIRVTGEPVKIDVEGMEQVKLWESVGG